MRKRSVKETCYAVRIGNPRKHRCYFMLGEDLSTPKLFQSEVAGCLYAQRNGAESPSIVKVQIREIGGK